MSCSLPSFLVQIQTGWAGEERYYVFPYNATQTGPGKYFLQLFWLSPHPKYILELSV